MTYAFFHQLSGLSPLPFRVPGPLHRDPVRPLTSQSSDTVAPAPRKLHFNLSSPNLPPKKGLAYLHMERSGSGTIGLSMVHGQIDGFSIPVKRIQRFNRPTVAEAEVPISVKFSFAFSAGSWVGELSNLRSEVSYVWVCG